MMPKICPLLSIAGLTGTHPERAPVSCQEETCAWWIPWNNGKDPECAIQALAILADLIR